jgi:putative membrane protein
MLLRAIVNVVVVAAVLLLLPTFIPGIEVAGAGTAVFVAIVWGFITLTVRPILGLLTLPINLLTFGLFSFILNALLFWALTLIDGFAVHGFVPALLGSVVLSALSFVLHRVFSRD